VAVQDLVHLVGQDGDDIHVRRRLDVPSDRVEEPQRGIRGVVLQGAGVRGVGEHAIRYGLPCPQQDLTCLAVPVRRKEQPLEGGHQIARPLPEPWVARGDRRAGWGADDELVGGDGELLVDRVRRLGLPAQIRRPLPRVADQLPGRR
jgi:hypothetical protein